MPVCSKCQVEKPETEFQFRDKVKGTRQSRCKPCKSAYEKSWYADNSGTRKQQVRKYNDATKAKNQELLFTYLSENPCLDCGEANPMFLDLDHVTGTKVKAVTEMIGDAQSTEKVLAEIAKCVVRCVKCHRIKTGRESNGKRYKWCVANGFLQPMGT